MEVKVLIFHATYFCMECAVVVIVCDTKKSESKRFPVRMSIRSFTSKLALWIFS